MTGRMLGTVTAAGGHPGPYELALTSQSTLETAKLVARRAEAARIDALFVPDLLTFGAQGTIGDQEPLVFVSALSQVTSHAGLIATVSTTFHHPFNLARLFGTLDHVSNGRAAWNLVTSSIGEENYGPGGLPSPAAGIALGAKYAEVVFTALPTLDDALTFTRTIRSQSTRPGLPLIFSSFHATYGATEAEAQRLVRERLEAIDYDRGRALVADMLGGAVDLSEAKLDEPLPSSLLPDISRINRRRGRAEIFSRLIREGRTLRELVQAAQDTGHWSVAGTPEQLADAVQQRFEAGVLDVLSINGIADDRTHDFVVNGLLVELRRRGIVKEDYRGSTLRDNWGLTL
ncbi:LLM class flavin-dependent oxidoreductase [Actinoplanes sp. CA-131856]